MDDLYLGNKCTLTLVDFPDQTDSMAMDDALVSVESVTPPLKDRITHKMVCSAMSTAAILTYINLINYMDRYTIPGVLGDIKAYYNLDDKQTGFLQTVFVASYLLLAPLFGYLGDRYNRKLLLSGGILFWTIASLLGSFVPRDKFALFLLSRCLVGIGEASYSTIAPTIIADYYTGSKRSIMLGIFYYAIPFGSGLGYIVAAQTASATGEWQWAMRVTPIFGVIAFFLCIVVLVDPPRGSSEGGVHLSSTSVTDDCKYLSKNPSYVWSSIGFTCNNFAVGSLSWWGPTFMITAININSNADSNRVNSIFGIITCFAGIVGISLGVYLSRCLRANYPKADPLICGVGGILSVPLLFIACQIAPEYTGLSWALLSLAITLLCLNWSIIADILLYTVVPTRRSFAQALQICFSHLFGDAASPYLVGAISDGLKGDVVNHRLIFQSLQTALYLPTFVLVLGAGAFFICSFYIEEDRNKCNQIIQGASINCVEPMEPVHRFENEVE